MSRENTVVAIDFETYYDKDYSVANGSYWHYVNDPRFDAYLVSIVCDEFEWVGNPTDFDWSLIDGMTWVSHNRPFDRAVYKRLCELGLIKEIAKQPHTDGDSPTTVFMTPAPYYWGDTACLAVYMRAPRSLAGAVKALFGISRSKDIRNIHMRGKHWSEFDDEMQAKVLEYALDDGRDCLRIWIEHADKWPEHERKIADLMDQRCQTGFTIDAEKLDEDIHFMGNIKFEVEQQIPWSGTDPILSPKALRQACAEENIIAPKSLAMDSEDCEQWENEYGDQFPWVAAMRTWRRANTIEKKLKAIRNRIRDDGRMEFSLLYMGAHTGRASGAGGFNMLNLARSPFYVNRDYHILHSKEDIAKVANHLKEHDALPPNIIGSVAFRPKFIAAKDKKLLIGDSSQIEARVTRWLARDTASLKLIENGFNPYEAHAMRFMGFNGESMKQEDPSGYQLAKARELSLGFGVGWMKFITMAGMYVDEEYFHRIFGSDPGEENVEAFIRYIHGIPFEATRNRFVEMWEHANPVERNTFVNSWLQVTDFRNKNPEIVNLWKRLGDEMKSSAGGNYEIELPSGRVLTYYNVSVSRDGVKARTERGGRFKYFHGGLLCENVVQATARDIFRDNQLLAHDRGFNILLDVYDELVCEEPQDRDPNELLEVMRTRPDWAKSLPIDAEVEESPHYKK